ncbi:type II secretion system protein [bacterium]|nr:type II secretion system protein [candidate division CSSED10-310 bacterium]
MQHGWPETVNDRWAERGYTLIELMTVVGILAVVGGLLFNAWTGYMPTYAIERAATKLASDLNFAAFQAVSTQNQWMVIFLYDANTSDSKYLLQEEPTGPMWYFRPHSYLIVNDDGWKGIPPRKYSIGDALRFEWYKRGDRKMGNNELVSGPHNLGKTISFYTRLAGESGTEYYSPDRIVFKWNWACEAWREFSSSGMWRSRPKSSLWIQDVHFDPTASRLNHDNNLHRRRIRVRPSARVEVTIL